MPVRLVDVVADRLQLGGIALERRNRREERGLDGRVLPDAAEPEPCLALERRSRVLVVERIRRFVEATAVKMEQRILAELADLESLAQLRHLETVHGIDLGSNDYLGLSTDPRMKQAIRDALDSSSRVASTGSRLLSGHDEVWTAVENDFARWVGAEAALYFTSGYAAPQ